MDEESSVLEARPKRKERRAHRDEKPPRKGRWTLILGFLAAAGLLVAGGVALRQSRPPTLTPRQEMITAAQVILRTTLKEGLQASFAGDEETSVEEMPDKKFRISAWVDLYTSDGRHDRQTYSVVVSRNHTDGWTGEQIAVIPQVPHL